MNKFLSLHILKKERVINLPTVSSLLSERSAGAERAENQVERSGALSGRCRKTMERSGAERSTEREVVEGKRSGERGLQKSVERGAAFRRSRRGFAHLLWLSLYRILN